MDTQAHGHSFVGRRQNNEDRYHVDARRGVFVVADGMGGQAGGEVASRLAVDAIRTFYERTTSVDLRPPDEDLAETVLDLAFRMAHLEVQRHREGALAGMGTTLAALHIQGDVGHIAHVGDSRVYRFRGGEIERVTHDHSLAAELEGAQVPYARAYSHVVTRAIGVGVRAEVDLGRVDIRAGDVFLLCSDGLTDSLPDERIASILGRMDGQLAPVALTASAYIEGSRDNITAVVVEVRDHDVIAHSA